MGGHARNAGHAGPAPTGRYQDGIGLGLGTGSLTEGSSFALNRATSGGGILSFWSRSASSSFQGRDGLLALGGDVRSTMFGADYQKGRMVTGVSLSHTRGIGSYDGTDTGRMTSSGHRALPTLGRLQAEQAGTRSGPSPATVPEG